MGQPQTSVFDRFEGKIEGSNLSAEQIAELFALYKRKSKSYIGRNRARVFAKDLVAWHKRKGNIKKSFDVTREVHIAHAFG